MFVPILITAHGYPPRASVTQYRDPLSELVYSAALFSRSTSFSLADATRQSYRQPQMTTTCQITSASLHLTTLFFGCFTFISDTL